MDPNVESKTNISGLDSKIPRFPLIFLGSQRKSFERKQAFCFEERCSESRTTEARKFLRQICDWTLQCIRQNFAQNFQTLNRLRISDRRERDGGFLGILACVAPTAGLRRLPGV